jgi:hypothetical protein
MDRYLVMGLSGGLGNQLFQYASGYGIARRLGAELRLHDLYLRDDERWMPALLGHRYRVASRFELARVGELGDGERSGDKAVRELVRLALRGERRLRGRNLPVLDEIRGPGIARFDPALLTLSLPTMLRGWYQTEQYFENVADEVHSHLRLPDVAMPEEIADGRPLVSVSFRRGDYVRLGWQLPFTYYEHALDRIVREVPGAHFLVLGDDPEFVRLVTDWVGRYGPATDAYEVADGTVEHLVLSSQCDHAVLANSSFAWWGAWLAERRAGRAPGLVLAPDSYPVRFGPGVVPERWELVPTG